MKEEASSKKLPPKMMGAGGGGGATAVVANVTSTPSKHHSDEILSTLLRINNFDSISSIKDESLDIDLSACVTISADPTGIIGGNSLSSSDFWRVLDESAQNPQLEGSCSSKEMPQFPSPPNAVGSLSADDKSELRNMLKQEQTSFTGTFLRPDLPSTSHFSPLKRNTKPLPVERVVKAADLAQTKEKLAGIIRMETAELDELNPSPKASVEPHSLATANTSVKHEASAVQSGPVAMDETNSENSKPPEPMYKCVDCDGLVLHGSQDLAAHCNHRILYKCVECHRDFDTETSLKKHLKTHRLMETRKDAWKKCPDCGKCLKLGSMWMHRKIHSENKKYGCEICGQKFVQKINLTHHSRIHTSEKPYECSECQKRFQERSHLQRHQKYHAQTRSYRCEKCGKMYKTERCLKVHNLVHLEQRPFACNVCDKSFISNSKLKQHSNIHTGERPFKCNYCPRDFTNFPNWLKHTRRRHKVDHKTGELLENIPSYCSKKSTRTAKSQKVVEAVNAPGTNTAAEPTKELAMESGTTVPVVAARTENTVAPHSKTTTRRKKKVFTADQKQSTDSVNSVKSASIESIGMTPGLSPPLSLVFSGQSSPVAAAEAVKVEKVKRERKQLMPKQVQQLPPPLFIKKELIEPKADLSGEQTKGNFPDLHCLSITSAEELIMEQALEMEECGLYKAPAGASLHTFVDTDNAISSEAAADLQLKVKQEQDAEIRLKVEDIGSIKRSRDMCSSLESSPFSSPASMEFAPSSTLTSISTDFNGSSNFYLPTFSISNQGGGETKVENVNCGSSSVFPGDQPQLLSGGSVTEVHLHAQRPQVGTKQAFINQFYLPLTVNAAPVLVKTNQALPSVDTLLFSHTKLGLFHGRSLTKQATAQHNLS